MVGREAERARVGALLEAARRGRTDVLVLVGDPGIGKTALIDDAVAATAGMAVLAVTAVESESSLAYAGLFALLRPLLELLPRIDEPQARALRVALALGDGEEPDLLAVSAGTLALLAEAAAERPVLVVVDDAQWLDRPSADAIAFAARRLRGEELAFLVGRRADEPTPFDSGFEQLTLAPLPRDEAEQLLSQRSEPVPAGAAGRLLDLADGNPLALLELPVALAAEVGSATGTATDRVRRAFAARLDSLSPAARLALLLAAAEPDPDAVRRAAAQLGIGEDELAAAESAGLVRLDARGIAFRHPLVRSLVYSSADRQERRAAHGALADVLGDDGSGDRRAWHLAAAATRPDEKIAALLEQTAGRARARGGYATEAAALERAAELSPDEQDRARRLHAACRAAYWAGEKARAVRLGELALTLAVDPLVRADLRHQLAVIADFDRDLRASSPSTALLERTAAEIEPLDPLRAVALLGIVLQRHRERLDAPAAHDVAVRRLALAERVGGERQTRALQDVAATHALRGDAADAAALLDRVAEARRADEDLPVYASQAAEPLLWLERYDELRDLLGRSLERARREENVLRVAFDLTNLATLELRLGRLDAAARVAAEALGLAESTRSDYLAACNLTVLAGIDARRGDGDFCRERAERAAALAHDLGDVLIAAEGRLALGVLALGEGRYDDAAAELEPLARVVADGGVGEPQVLPYAVELVEAYARTGRADDARRELDLLAAAAEAVGRESALAGARRCRGLLAADEAYEAELPAAIAAYSRQPLAFERARTRLVYGERLRRAGRRRDAREQLRAALEELESIGARPWAERAQAELQATGERVLRHRSPGVEQLTPQELQIADLVGEGKTNKEIATQLFLSPKTIEYHLGNTYRKLDVHSRAELTRVLTAQPSA
jgi:DNA-binding CsgD family transcriptional regulator/tetratricopeptide (TPR) repeat protein